MLFEVLSPRKNVIGKIKADSLEGAKERLKVMISQGLWHEKCSIKEIKDTNEAI